MNGKRQGEGLPTLALSLVVMSDHEQVPEGTNLPRWVRLVNELVAKEASNRKRRKL